MSRIWSGKGFSVTNAGSNLSLRNFFTNAHMPWQVGAICYRTQKLSWLKLSSIGMFTCVKDSGWFWKECAILPEESPPSDAESEWYTSTRPCVMQEFGSRSYRRTGTNGRCWLSTVRRGSYPKSQGSSMQMKEQAGDINLMLFGLALTHAITPPH